MARHRPSPTLIVVLLAVVALAGCTAPAPEPTPTPMSPSTTAPAPEPVDVGPTPRIDVTCDDVVDPVMLQAFVGMNTQPLTLVDPADRVAPDTAANEQLGALSCTWTNGLSGSPFMGPDPDAQTVTLQILPEGIDAAIEYVDLYQIADPTYGDHVQGPRCLGPADGMDPAFCELYGVIGQTWVELTVLGIVASTDVTAADLVSAFRTVIDPMVVSIGSMTPRERWTSFAPSDLADADCDALAP